MEENTPKKPVVRKTLYTMFFKRFFDMLLSGLALIILSPVFLIVSIVCRIKMGKGIIFKNYRPGKNNKIFKLFRRTSSTLEYI